MVLDGSKNWSVRGLAACVNLCHLNKNNKFWTSVFLKYFSSINAQAFSYRRSHIHENILVHFLKTYLSYICDKSKHGSSAFPVQDSRIMCSQSLYQGTLESSALWTLMTCRCSKTHKKLVFKNAACASGLGYRECQKTKLHKKHSILES